MKPFETIDLDTVQAHLISAGDTVKLAPLAGPEKGIDHSVFLEIWEPGGAQPPNSHSDEVETFLFLRGEGVAEVDGVEAPVKSGQFLVLAPGTVHRISNTGEGRLYAITTMLPDGGFHKLVTDGQSTTIDAADLDVLASVFGSQA
ncbi:cupin domain-containing protein [Nocardioides sp. zg-536]|uniref:Cupin domain-containing protein n=1 Tax=Nocardioides faecalis TaxID=2803858 RepID=A0A939BSU7_9ACTN|nr:cupin domain-containing protein [Nocardioides faecalis]MBM9459999.1 cupin domain-containing protein [Nocardioides faecalis]MBS4753133.1 cupin domain-containing protein [Nocardioides faecalis]QVI58780.1 cupin domain-containing protein [Nocardioides faecalis]